MKDINHIEKAIEQLQSLKEQDAVVEKIEIDYGIRIATPIDVNYCKWAETKVPDGSFFMRIYGKKLKQLLLLYAVGIIVLMSANVGI